MYFLIQILWVFQSRLASVILIRYDTHAHTCTHTQHRDVHSHYEKHSVKIKVENVYANNHQRIIFLHSRPTFAPVMSVHVSVIYMKHYIYLLW
jgi:hypothetical protein